jgi:hypothetical protein
MGLGNRNARRHGSNDSQSAYWQFKPGQRVMTVDGFAGVVASVEDGPHAGNEHYIVNLDSGMGGGAYQPGQLTALRQETAEHHTAGDDYPELSQILMERPDIAPNVVASRKTANASCPNCNIWTVNRNPGDSCPGCNHQMAHESEGTLRPQDQDLTPRPYHGALSLDHDNPHNDHYMSTEDCPEGEQPGFENGHLTWGGQAAQGEGNDYSLFPMPRTANASCPQCGFYDGMMDGGGPCPLCGADTEGTTHEPPDESYSESCPTCGYYSGSALTHHDMCPVCKTPTQHTAGQFNGTEECDHCGSAAHSTGEHNNIDLREQNPDAVDYGHECEYCGSEDHTTDDHEDEPQDDDAFIHHDGSASFGHKSLGRPPYGHDDPHDWAHHAIENAMQTEGYYPNIWDENGNSCHEHHRESVANELHREHPLIGMKPPCPFCQSHNQSDASGHGQEPFDESKHGLQTEHLSRCHDCKAVYDPCEADETGHMQGEDAPLEGKDPEEHAERAVEDAFSGLHPAAYDLLNDNKTGPSKFSSLSVYAILVDAAADPEFRFEVTASWKDVRNKAKRLRTTGQVTITAASDGAITGVVKGDHFTYETQIQRLPGHFGVAVWQCGCKWAAYAWGRSPRYKHLEGRMCSHALALHYEAQSRGMFGKVIYEDTVRPTWLRANSPIVVQYDKDRDRNETRRAVPPGNMKMTFGSVDQQGATKRQAMDEVTDAAEANGHDNLAWVHTGQGHSHLYCDDCGLRSTVVDWPGHGWAASHHMLGHPCIDHGETDHGSRCPACGESSDYCQGHGQSGDPVGHSILRNHEDGVHDDCASGACEGRNDYYGGEETAPPSEHGIDLGTAWEGPNYTHEDPFAPRRLKPEDAGHTLDHIDRALRGESALHLAVREAVAQGEDPADIALVMHTAMITKAGRFFHAYDETDDPIIYPDQCPACGGPTGHCGGTSEHGYGDHAGDEFAEECIDKHEHGDHSLCNPWGCDDAHDMEGRPPGNDDAMHYQADQQYEDDSMASDGGAGGDNGEEGFSPTLDAGDPTTGQPAALSVEDYDETSAGYKDGSSSYFGGGIGSTGAVTDPGGIPQGPQAAMPGAQMNAGDAQEYEDQSAPNAEDDEHSAYAADQARRATLNLDPEPALPTTDGSDNDLEENPVVNSLAPNGGEDDRTASRHYAEMDPMDYGPTQEAKPQQDEKKPSGGLPMGGLQKLLPGAGAGAEGAGAAASVEELAPLLLAANVQLHQDEEPVEEESAPELTDNAVAANLRYNENVDSLWGIVEQFQRSAAHLDPGPGGNSGENDIAAAAREYLQKSALKDFTPGEQAALINEGEGVTAANLDRLSIEGTHYEALEAALAAEDSDPVGWLD